MTNTEQIRDCIKYYKTEAKSAEREYDRLAKQIQNMASNTIDLFGGHATSQVADIASMSRKACDGLFSSYQMIVRMVDEKCRPLLNDEVDTAVVGDVADFIEWLNDESEIENNVSASVNSTSYGEFASIRYVPSMENKMIQKYWEQKYSERSDKEEANARRKAEEKAALETEQKRRQIEQNEKKKIYEEEYAVWKKKYDEIAPKRDQWVNDRLAEEGSYNKKCIENTYNLNKKRIEDSLCLAQARLAMLQENSSNSCLKKENAIKIQNTVSQTKTNIETLTKDLSTTTDRYTKQIEEMDRVLKEKKKELEEQVKEIYPLEKEPRRPFDFMAEANTRLEREYAEYMEAIYHYLESVGGSYTISELMASVDELGALSAQRVSAILRMMKDKGALEREEIQRQAYFKLA